MEYSIPHDLVEHIALVHPIVTFAMNGPKVLGVNLHAVGQVQSNVDANNVQMERIDESCATKVTPACLQALYGIPKTPATQASNRLGVPGIIQQWAQVRKCSTVRNEMMKP